MGRGGRLERERERLRKVRNKKSNGLAFVPDGFGSEEGQVGRRSSPQRSPVPAKYVEVNNDHKMTYSQKNFTTR